MSEIFKYAFIISWGTAIVSASCMTGYLKERGIIKSRTGFNFMEVILKYIETTQKEKGKIGNWFWATVVAFILGVLFSPLMVFSISSAK